MSSSNWRQPTVEDDWESCPSETTNNSATPPPKYSSLHVADNIGARSDNTLRREILQEQRDMDLEYGDVRPLNPPLSWYEEICNRLSVKKPFNRIPVRQIYNYITPENICRSFGAFMLCVGCLTAIVVGAVLAWDLIIYVVVNRTKACSKSG